MMPIKLPALSSTDSAILLAHQPDHHMTPQALITLRARQAQAIALFKSYAAQRVAQSNK